MTTVGYIVDVVEKKALDEQNDDTSQAELVGLYNLAIKMIVSLVPRAFTKTASLKLSAGIQQSIASDGLAILDIPMNMGTNGTTPGAAIREADLKAMTDMVPTWTTATAAAVIKHFMQIDGEDRLFYVYPPADGTSYVKATVSATPPETTYDDAGDWENDIIPLSDEYINAVPDAMLYNKYDDDTDVPGTKAVGQIYWQRVLNLLKIKTGQSLMREQKARQ